MVWSYLFDDCKWVTPHSGARYREQGYRHSGLAAGNVEQQRCGRGAFRDAKRNMVRIAVAVRTMFDPAKPGLLALAAVRGATAAAAIWAAAGAITALIRAAAAAARLRGNQRTLGKCTDSEDKGYGQNCKHALHRNLLGVKSAWVLTRGHNGSRSLRLWHARRCLDPKHAEKYVAWRRGRHAKRSRLGGSSFSQRRGRKQSYIEGDGGELRFDRENRSQSCLRRRSVATILGATHCRKILRHRAIRAHPVHSHGTGCVHATGAG